MDRRANSERVVRAGLTLASLLSALAMLAIVLRADVFGGLNFAMIIYMVPGGAGSIGLLAGCCMVFSRKTFFRWSTGLGALAVGVLSLILICDFFLDRAQGVPPMNPLYIGHLPIPLMAIYGFTFLCCSALAFLSLEGARRRAEI